MISKQKVGCRIGDLEMKPKHKPVLLEEVVGELSPRLGEAYFDGTAGYGGHAAAIIERIGPTGWALLVDRDSEAIAALGERFGPRAQLMRAGYLEAARELAEEHANFDMILLDLGVSSPQLDNSERGFSFNTEAALDMRMDQSQKLTAATVVNNYRPEELERVIREYGEEPRWRAVVRAIVESRPFVTTVQLAAVVRPAAVATRGIDPATRTFQAIRIEVNRELDQLREALPVLENLLNPGGRLAVISFHSLEDRIVKEFFDRQSRDCVCPPKQPICNCEHPATLGKLTRRVVTATADEIANNPRARSAKLRAAEKLKPTGGT
jgi:16S rRNA (cytosine1402-N4)-methyltransferase